MILGAWGWEEVGKGEMGRERERERWRDGGEQEINVGGGERKMRPH